MRVDPLLADYPVRIREVTIGVILGISLIFYVLPRFLGEGRKTEYNMMYVANETENLKVI